MQLKTPDEVVLTDAFRLGDGLIFNYMDARKFLLTDSAKKNPIDRLISYLIYLKIIVPNRSKWSQSLLKATDMYYDHLKFYFEKSQDDPLAIVSTKTETALRTDITKAMPYFKSIDPSFGLDLSKKIDIEFRISRIFAVLEREHPEIQYTQGYDKYGYIYFALALRFCQQGNLPLEFAEAIAYHLVCSTLSLIPMARLLDNQKELVKHFNDLDKILLNYDRPKYNLLSSKGVSILLFGVKFELLLFADEHDIESTLRIWDQIFGRLESYNYMINAFTIAHTHQIKIPENCINALDEIKKFKNWNVDQLITDAGELMAHKRSFKESMCKYCCPKLPQYHGYILSPDAL